MSNLFILGLSLFLIIVPVYHFIKEWNGVKRKNIYSSLIKAEKVQKIIVRNTSAESIFGKMVSKNNQLSNFLGKLENNHLWKVYAIVTIFTTLLIINRVFKFIKLEQTTIAIILFVTVILVIIVPSRISKSIYQKRIIRLNNDVPLLIDMLAIMIQSGMTVENALRYVKSQFKPINRDLTSILERACYRMDINGINSALELIYEEVPSKEMKMLCSTLQQSVNYGSSIYQILMELSTEIREIQVLETEEKISAASAKMTLPMMLFILFPILVVILAPVIIKLVRMFL